MVTKTIEMLQPHESLKITDDTEVMRVPGGYLYTHKKHCVFVPKTYDPDFEMTTEQRKEYWEKHLSTNLGEDWRKASKEDIIDVIIGQYIPF